MSIVARQRRRRKGQPFDEAAGRRHAHDGRDEIEQQSAALAMSGRIYDDGVIDPRDTRNGAGPVPDARFARSRPRTSDLRSRFGVFRMWMRTMIRSCWWPTGGESPARLRHLLGDGHRDASRHSDADADSLHVADADVAVRCPATDPAKPT
jgi:hypothetical protein